MAMNTNSSSSPATYLDPDICLPEILSSKNPMQRQTESLRISQCILNERLIHVDVHVFGTIFLPVLIISFPKSVDENIPSIKIPLNMVCTSCNSIQSDGQSLLEECFYLGVSTV